MKFSRVHRIVTSEPWLVTPAAHTSIRELVEAHIQGSDLPIALDYEAPKMDVQDGVAIIPIAGVIGKGLSAIEKSCGACGIEDIAANLAEAATSPEVRSILLHFDSPGGAVTGVPELANVIAAVSAQRPVVAYTDGQMCSAAYWLGAGARAIYASDSAEVGSIGVYMPWVDQTKAYEAEGYKVEVIKNKGGTFKGMGVPGTSLTDDQRAHLQDRVDQIFGMFTGHVTRSRSVKADALRGQSFLAAEAKQVGLVDRIGSLADAMAEAREIGRKLTRKD